MGPLWLPSWAKEAGEAHVLWRPGTSPTPRVAQLLFIRFGNFDFRRDPIGSLFPVRYLQRGTALPGESLNGLFRPCNLSLVVIHECHLRLVGGSFDSDDFLLCINLSERS